MGYNGGFEYELLLVQVLKIIDWSMNYQSSFYITNFGNAFKTMLVIYVYAISTITISEF